MHRHYLNVENYKNVEKRVQSTTLTKFQQKQLRIGNYFDTNQKFTVLSISNITTQTRRLKFNGRDIVATRKYFY